MKKLFLISFAVGIFLLLLGLVLCGIGITFNLAEDGTVAISMVLCFFVGTIVTLSSLFALVILDIMED